MFGGIKVAGVAAMEFAGWAGTLLSAPWLVVAGLLFWGAREVHKNGDWKFKVTGWRRWAVFGALSAALISYGLDIADRAGAFGPTVSELKKANSELAANAKDVQQPNADGVFRVKGNFGAPGGIRTCGRYSTVDIQLNTFIGDVPPGYLFDDCAKPGDPSAALIAQNELKIAQIAMIYSITADYFEDRKKPWSHSPSDLPSYDVLNEYLARRNQGFRVRASAKPGQFEMYKVPIK